MFTASQQKSPNGQVTICLRQFHRSFLLISSSSEMQGVKPAILCCSSMDIYPGRTQHHHNANVAACCGPLQGCNTTQMFC